MRVLVVDDTIVYRSQIKEILSHIPFISFIETAPNGKIGIQKIGQLNFDVVITDLEMPEMNGIDMIKEIRKNFPKIHIIVLSSISRSVMELTFESLKSGANDFISKPTDVLSLEESLAKLKNALLPIFSGLENSKSKVSVFDLQRKEKETQGQIENKRKNWKKVNIYNFLPKVIVIASSTGGPVALEKLFSGFAHKSCPPILIAQHMPPKFTALFAERLEKNCSVVVKEAQDGDKIQKGHIYIAPGDFHMELNQTFSGLVLSLNQDEKRNFVRPAADNLFESAARIIGSNLLGIVLTGMGEDGCAGSIAIKDALGAVFIQNEESCVVWGMAGATYKAGAYDEIGNLEVCRKILDTFVI